MKLSEWKTKVFKNLGKCLEVPFRLVIMGWNGNLPKYLPLIND